MSRELVVLKGSPGRCAYCHAGVDSVQKTACAACLAIHHVECWAADGRCASCQTESALVPARDADRAGLALGALRRRRQVCVHCEETVDRPERAACAVCLSLHHDECWRETGACAFCGSAEVLVRESRGRAPRVKWTADERRRLRVGISAVLLMLALGVTYTAALLRGHWGLLFLAGLLAGGELWLLADGLGLGPVVRRVRGWVRPARLRLAPLASGRERSGVRQRERRPLVPRRDIFPR